MRRAILAAVALACAGFHSHLWQWDGYVTQHRRDGDGWEVRSCASDRCDCGAVRIYMCSDWHRALISESPAP